MELFEAATAGLRVLTVLDVAEMQECAPTKPNE